MKGLGQALILVASLAGSVSAAEPGDVRWRSVLGSIEASIPSKPIKSIAIAPNKDTQGGDVLISFESEVNNIRKQYEAQGFEVVIPKTNILAEFPVAWVDKNVQANGTEKAAKAYLNWLYSPQAQTIITDYYYRVNNPQVMDKLKDKFPQTELFRVEDQFGAWPEVMKSHFVSGGELDKLLAAGRK